MPNYSASRTDFLPVDCSDYTAAGAEAIASRIPIEADAGSAIDI